MTKPRDVQAIVEQQLLRWRIERQQHDAQQSLAERELAPPPPRERPRVITIGHAHGAHGAAIARRVGELAGLPVYDREIVAHIAGTAHVRYETVATLDEHAANRLEDYISALLAERNFDRSDFLRYLSSTIVALWEHGPCVMVGHGCVHLVPRSHALAVRITARQLERIQRLAERDQLDLHGARRRLQRIDAEREAYHRRYFDAAIDSPHNYDLLIDSTAMSVDVCAKIIAAAYRSKFRTGA